MLRVFYGKQPTMHMNLTVVDLGLNNESWTSTGNNFAIFILLKKTSGTKGAFQLLTISQLSGTCIFTSSGREGLNLRKVDSHGITFPLTRSQDQFTSTTGIHICSMFIQTEEALLYSYLWNVLLPSQIKVPPILIPISYWQTSYYQPGTHFLSYNSLGGAARDITGNSSQGRRWIHRLQ